MSNKTKIDTGTTIFPGKLLLFSTLTHSRTLVCWFGWKNAVHSQTYAFEEVEKNIVFGKTGPDLTGSIALVSMKARIERERRHMKKKNYTVSTFSSILDDEGVSIVSVFQLRLKSDKKTLLDLFVLRDSEIEGM